MIVEAKMSRRADILARRRRKPETAMVEGRVTARIREVSGADAPVAIVHRKWGRAEPMPIRVMEDLAYGPVLPGNDRETSIKTASAKFERLLSYFGLEANGFYIRNLQESDVLETYRDGRVGIEAIAQKLADEEMLVVDGVAYARVRSPLVLASNLRETFAGIPQVADQVACWFTEQVGGMPLVDFLRGLPVLLPPAAGRVFDMFDFDVVVPDLVEGCRRRLVANVDPSSIQRSMPIDRETWIPDRHSQLGKVAAEYLAHSHRSSKSSDLDALATRMRSVVALRTRPPVLPSQSIPDGSRTLLVPSRVLGRDHHDRFFVDGLQDEMQFLPSDIPSIEASTLVHVASHPRARMASTFWNGKEFFGTGPRLSSFPRNEHLDRWGRLDVSRGEYEEDLTRFAKLANDIVHDAAALLQRPISSPSKWGNPFSGIVGGTFDDADEMIGIPNGTIVDEFCRKAMVSDGDRILYRCPEPVLRLTLMGEMGRAWVEVVQSNLIMAHPGADAEVPFLFRLDRIEDALAAAEAFERPVGRPAIPTVVRPDLLSFDQDSWNLKAALRRVFINADRRIALLDPSIVESYVDLYGYLDAWAGDAHSGFTPEREARFLEDAAVVLQAIDDPVYDGICAPAYREMAWSCLTGIRMRSADPGEDEEDDMVLASGF